MSFPFLASDLNALEVEIAGLSDRYEAMLLDAGESPLAVVIGEAVNVDFDASRRDAAALAGDLSRLQALHSQAEIVAPAATTETVAIGSRVVLKSPPGRDEIELGSYYLADERADSDRVSCNSPLGRALLGRRRGEVVTGIGPNKLSYTIVDIQLVKQRELVSA